MHRVTTLAIIAMAALGCGQASDETPTDPAKALQLALLNASPGDVIEIPAGRLEFERSLSLKVDGVMIRGAGMDATVLSFANQIAGAEGLLVSASDFTIEDLAIEDTKGDALKILSLIHI